MLTYDDFPPGRMFALGPKHVTAQDIVAFAEKYDPQPFHLDADSHHAKQVGGLIASGWHTCGLLMRMMCDSFLLETASQGSGGLQAVRWLAPVRPGDTLSGEAKVITRRVSKSRPNLGVVDWEYRLDNQAGDTVLTSRGSGFVDVHAK